MEALEAVVMSDVHEVCPENGANRTRSSQLGLKSLAELLP